MLDVLGERIKILRTERGLTQLDLAAKLNIGNTTLSQYESGQRIPSDEIKLKICEYFDVTLDYLLGASNSRQTKKAPLSDEKGNLVVSSEEMDLLSTVADLDADELKKIQEYAEFVKSKRNSSSVLLAARDEGGFNPIDNQAEEKARIIKEHPKSTKKLP